MTFTSWDGTQLFYRAWLPEGTASKCVLLLHRGHEHSGRFEELAHVLRDAGFAVFAYDARGHGQSPGDRGWAESFACLARDADCFARHVTLEHGIENLSVVAHSIGAVVAALWVHDYGPRVRALVLASPAFRVKLYVPFALAFLRLRMKFQRKAFVKSYVRASMLTHDEVERASYANDPLITRSVAVNLLVKMHDASTRLLRDAAAFRLPVLLLSSGKDYVVSGKAQRDFFDLLGSDAKEFEEYAGCYHDLLHESGREKIFERIREFLLSAPAIDEPVPRNTDTYARLAAAPPRRIQRAFLKSLRRLSGGIRIGWQSGFDSGESLAYVYRNQASSPVDRIYLNAPGWRGVRERKQHIEAFLAEAIARIRESGREVRVFDPACGQASYVTDRSVCLMLRDWSQENVDAAAKIARERGMACVTASRGDAFDRQALAAVRPRPNVGMVSGLYELFPDNAKVLESLRGLADAMERGGYLIYTNQPWHPQLDMIARVLTNREGKPWVMRCRAQAEMDSLVRAAGFEKIETRVCTDAIFTVSLAVLP